MFQGFIGTAYCGVSEVQSWRLASGPGAQIIGCRIKEISVLSNFSDSAAVFSIHCFFNYCIVVSINIVTC